MEARRKSQKHMETNIKNRNRGNKWKHHKIGLYKQSQPLYVMQKHKHKIKDTKKRPLA